MPEISYSQLSTWLTCRKKWYYHYKLGLSSNKFVPARDKGSAFHKMLSITKGKYDFDIFKVVWWEQLDKITKEYDSRGWDSGDVDKELNTGLVWANRICKSANEMHISELWSTYEPEVQFLEPIHEGLGVNIHGFLDGIITMASDSPYGYKGERKIIEHKTTGQYQEGNVELDLQQGIYQMIFGMETLYIWYTANGIKLIPFKFNDIAIEHVKQIVERCIEDMHNEDQYLVSPQGACYNYCDFGKLCIVDFHGYDTDEIIRENYIRGEHNEDD